MNRRALKAVQTTSWRGLCPPSRWGVGLRKPQRHVGSEKALTILEILIAMALLTLVIGVAVLALQLIGRQCSSATDTLNQTQAALLLLERIRLELSSIVMNPFRTPKLNEGNSFVISQPNGTSIQFVTECRNKGERVRRLVYYEASIPPAAKTGVGLTLKKTAWRFNYPGIWQDPIRFPAGWPKSWIGPVVEREEPSFRALGTICDMQWQYLAPLEAQGQVFFRVKLVLQAAGGCGFLPFTTLVGVPTPDLPVMATICPCLFDTCFQPSAPNCGCCNIRSK